MSGPSRARECIEFALTAACEGDNDKALDSLLEAAADLVCDGTHARVINLVRQRILADVQLQGAFAPVPF